MMPQNLREEKSQKLQEKDFIEIEFNGKIKGGEIFDSNIKENLKKINPNLDDNLASKQARPFVFCLGEGMFLKGIDDFLIGKSAGNYNIELSPEKAFGNRNSNLVQLMPMKVFVEHKLNPVPGAVLNFDDRFAKVLAVSGGRVIVDFNSPLAGKSVIYEIKVLRKVTDMNEKAKALIEFLFKREMEFNIEGKKIMIKAEKQLTDIVKMFKDKFKEILGLELEVLEAEKNKENKENDVKKESKNSSKTNKALQ